MDMLMDPDHNFITGFNMHTSVDAYTNEQEVVRNEDLHFNETTSLLFKKSSERYSNGAIKK